MKFQVFHLGTDPASSRKLALGLNQIMTLISPNSVLSTRIITLTRRPTSVFVSDPFLSSLCLSRQNWLLAVSTSTVLFVYNIMQNEFFFTCSSFMNENNILSPNVSLFE